MIKVMLFGFILILQQISIASVAPTKSSNQDAYRQSIKHSEITIGPLQLTKQKIKIFEKYTGKKMNFITRIYVKILEKKLKKKLSRATISKSLYNNSPSKWGNFTSDFNAAGFFLGFLLPIWGVLIAYLIYDKQRKQRIKWAWVGFATVLTLGLILILIIALNGGIEFNLF